jgi:hypothetical protein
MAFPR